MTKQTQLPERMQNSLSRAAEQYWLLKKVKKAVQEDPRKEFISCHCPTCRRYFDIAWYPGTDGDFFDNNSATRQCVGCKKAN